jgi:hypothetical protein
MIPWWAFLLASLAMFGLGHWAGNKLARRHARMLWDKEMRDILEAVNKLHVEVVQERRRRWSSKGSRP